VLVLSARSTKGERWKTQRKLLSPAFHYEILKQFLPTINEQSRILLDLLTEWSKGEEYFDVSQMLTNLTLDIISGKKIKKVVLRLISLTNYQVIANTETAMGRKVKAQTDPNCVYVKAVHA